MLGQELLGHLGQRPRFVRCKRANLAKGQAPGRRASAASGSILYHVRSRAGGLDADAESCQRGIPNEILGLARLETVQ
jgi:hypothetical protein